MRASNRTGYALISIVLISSLVAVILQGPVPQDIRYHDFSDTRHVFSIPNFWNITSNLVFLLVGITGLYGWGKSKKLHIIEDIRTGYGVLFVSVALVAFGSGYYHYSPDNSTLVWDRLPMSIAFMAFFSIIIGEFVSVKTGKLLLFPMIILGIMSVSYWHFSEARGAGDLRVYVLVQYTPLLLIPIILVCFKGTYSHIHAYWIVLLAYSLAKLAEYFDTEIYQVTGFISGHSIKHIIAALGIYYLLVSYEKRRQCQAPASRIPVPRESCL